MRPVAGKGRPARHQPARTFAVRNTSTIPPMIAITYGRRITTGTSGFIEWFTAKYAVEEAARLTKLACEATKDSDHSTAVRHLCTLFNCEKGWG